MKNETKIRRKYPSLWDRQFFNKTSCKNNNINHLILILFHKTTAMHLTIIPRKYRIRLQ